MVLDQPILFQRNYHIISTVGLGDLSPQTEIGKVFTVIYIFSASVSAPGVFVALFAQFARALLRDPD
jgi:hypothetical protein